MRGPHDLVGSAGRLPLYGRILAVQLLLFWFVRAGMRRSGCSLRALIDGSRWSLARWTRYVAMGIAGWALWSMFGAVLGSFVRPTSEELQAVLRFLPHGPVEKLCWVAFSVGTNFCEEVLYRGYLLRQFRALTGSALVALLLQAIVFGMAHVPLGMALVLSVSLLALFLGALTLWQKSLAPAMIAHICLSVFAGLLSST
jgi:membrane protease YdiL (CAAX protease family)